MKNIETENTIESGADYTSHQVPAAPELEAAIDAALGLKVVAMRLDTSLLDDIKALAELEGIGHIPYMRQLLAQGVAQAKAKQTEPPAYTPTYTATAYRWGSTNEHHYPVANTSDKTTAIAMADAESDYRGGKYGVVVLEWTASDACREVHYAGSCFGETFASDNQNLEMFRAIGQTAFMAATEGFTWKAKDSGDDESKWGTMERVPVTVPAWLTTEINERAQHAYFMEACINDARENRSNPKRSKEELAAWIAQTRVTVDAEVAALWAMQAVSPALDETVWQEP